MTWYEWLYQQRGREDQVGRFATFVRLMEVAITPEMNQWQASARICDRIPPGRPGDRWVWGDLVQGWAIAREEWRRGVA